MSFQLVVYELNSFVGLHIGARLHELFDYVKSVNLLVDAALLEELSPFNIALLILDTLEAYDLLVKGLVRRK